MLLQSIYRYKEFYKWLFSPRKDHRVRRAHKDPKVRRDLKGRRVHKPRKDPKVRKVHRDPKDTLEIHMQARH